MQSDPPTTGDIFRQRYLMGEVDRFDEPVTPAGRFFLHPKMQQFVNGVFGFKYPIDVDAIKTEILNSLACHPRFKSVLVTDEKGVEYWRRVKEVDIHKHVFLVPLEDEESGGDDFVNEYVAGLTIDTTLDLTKPLWEIHLLRSNRCCVVRFHHALGDGVSQMALFLSMCRRVDNPSLPPTIPGIGKGAKVGRKTSVVEKVWTFVMMMWYSFVYILDFLLHSLWLRDEKTLISGGDGVELWPRKVRTVTFQLADMKLIKNTTVGTINDVLLGVISLGLERYLELRTQSKTPKPVRITGMTMVNIRLIRGLQDMESLMKNNKEKSRWGNNFGYILLPLYLWKGSSGDPLQHVRRAKEMTGRKKLSLEALFSLRGGSLIMSLLGKEIATKINYRIISNTTFTLSNIMGPSEEMMFAQNPITYIRTTSTGLPHAITMHMVSYMDKADLEIQVVKEIIPDPDVLVRCFEEAMTDMKIKASALMEKKDKKE